MEENVKIEEKKESIKKWLKDPYNLALIGILVFAFILRFYYFWLTKNQPLWWDEADYMAYSKNLAGFTTHWIVTEQHNSLFSYLASILFKLGFSEPILKFILEFIPSILLVYLSYHITVLMYRDKRIALITCFLTTTFWELLFNSFRFHVDNPSLLFAYLAIYVFWKGYEKKENLFRWVNPKWTIPLTIFFLALSYALRRGYVLFIFFFLIYILATTRFRTLIKDKYNWIALFIGAILFLISEKLIFISKLTYVASTYYSSSRIEFNLIPFQIFKVFFDNISKPSLSVLFYLFWTGFILLTIKLLFSVDYLRKRESYSESRADLFNFIVIIVTLSFFLFFTRMSPETGIGDPRWYYSLLLSSIICISKAILLTDYIKKYSKIIPILLVIGLIGFGGYYELQHADMIIKAKIPSFKGIKDASLFLKGVSNPEDIITTMSDSQGSYYAERRIIEPRRVYNGSLIWDIPFELFINGINKNNNIKYIIVTFSEPNHPSWMRQEEYIQNPQTGQIITSKWKIPFMNTTIDFATGQQDIKQEVSYGKIKFRLLNIFEDAFVYEILREN